MNAKRLLKKFAVGVVALSMAAYASGYILTKDSGGYVIKWPPGLVPMQIKLPTAPLLSDGTSQSGSVLVALQAWNGRLGTVQFSSQSPDATAYATGNDKNEIVMDSTAAGEEFGTNVLAVTISWRDGNTRIESDIIFNAARTWDSYRGGLRAADEIRRVAIHELGHVLGLGHPDESGQSVSAIMNSRESNIDTMQSDDVLGAHSLYGAPGIVPSNNNFGNAAGIFLSNNSAELSGTNVSANAESFEPRHAGEVATHSVWWKWTASGNGNATITTENSNFDTVLGVYTGLSVSSLTSVASNDDQQDGIIRTSIVNFPVVSGITYYIAVDGWDGATGSIVLHVAVSPSLIPPRIITDPSNQVTPLTQTAQFSITASGDPAPSYQWQRLPAGSNTWGNLTNSSAYLGVTTSQLTVLAAVGMDGDRFRCIATNTAGSATSGPALLSVAAPIGGPVFVTRPLTRIARAGETITVGASAVGAGVVTYAWKHNGVIINGMNGPNLNISQCSRSDSGSYEIFASDANGTTKTLFFLSIAPANGGVKAWGAGFSGETTVPAGVDNNIIGIATGHSNSFAIRGDGSIVQWGAGFTQPPPSNLTGVVALEAGADHALALKADGAVVAWGYQGYGATNIPPNLDSVVAIAAGDSQSLALKADGTLVQWGMADAPVPSGLTDVVGIACGRFDCLALKANGTVVVWGNNPSHGSIPGDLVSGTAIATGWYHALALKLDGTVTGWGSDSLQSPPLGLQNVAAISTTYISSNGQSLALLNNGSVVAWGGSTPLPQGLTDVYAISSGAFHSLALVALPKVRANDFDGDGKSDVFLTNMSTSDRAIWLMNGSSIGVGASLGAVPLGWSVSCSGDVDGDGKTDIFLTNTSTGERAVWLMNGTTIGLGMSFGFVPLEWSVNHAGDFDGDGKADLFWTNTTTGERGIWLMNGTSAAAAVSSGTVPLVWSVNGVGDFDGDGKADVLWTNTVTGERGIWLMNGTTVARGATFGVVPVEWVISGTGDFNGNGTADILWTNTVSGERAIWLMQGVSIATGASLGSVPLTWSSSSVGDFDGNGKSDILLTNTSSGQRGVWLMNGIVISATSSLGIVSSEWLIAR